MQHPTQIDPLKLPSGGRTYVAHRYIRFPIHQSVCGLIKSANQNRKYNGKATDSLVILFFSDQVQHTRIFVFLDYAAI